MKKDICRNLLFCAVTAFLVAVTALCVTVTAVGQSHIEDKEMEEFYRAKEKETVEQVRTYLNGNGFQNSGIALTRVVDGEGNREYTLTIHHDRIDAMDEEARDALRDALSVFGFTSDRCSFRQEFLIVSDL